MRSPVASTKRRERRARATRFPPSGSCRTSATRERIPRRPVPTGAMSEPRPKHFSMIRGFHLADFLTLGNAACGVGAVFLAMLYTATLEEAHFYVAAALAPAALAFDVLDGRVARWRQQHSPLGRELDSLADVISFGVAPAVLAFAAGMSGGWDAVILIYFVCCGVSRLARYNVTAELLSEGGAKVKYFEGPPIPTS